jgi:hypothetical protein
MSSTNEFYSWVSINRESFRRSLMIQTQTDIPEDPDVLAAYAIDLITSPQGYEMVMNAISLMMPVGESKSVDFTSVINTGLSLAGGLLGVDMSGAGSEEIAAANERAAEAQSNTINILLYIVAGIAVIFSGVYIFTKVKGGK